MAERAFWEGMSQVAITKALGRPIPRHLRKAKLALSLPVLAALRVLRPEADKLIRFQMAAGALNAQFSPYSLLRQEDDDADG